MKEQFFPDTSPRLYIYLDAVLLSAVLYRIFFIIRDMPFILDEPSRLDKGVEVITPQDTLDLDLESLRQIVRIYRETEAKSACV